MAWGVECDDGWYDLLADAMEKVQLVCDLSTQAGKPCQLVASQVKEKFGTLSFYYFTECSDPVVHRVLDDIIGAAERSSSSVCERTGKRGALCVRGGWYKTLSRAQARLEGYKACDEGVEEYWSELDAKDADKKASEPEVAPDSDEAIR